MSVPAGTPVILYTTSGMPIGSFAAITMYRITAASLTINGTAYAAAPVVASGGLASGGTSLGVFIFEKMTLSPKGDLVKRGNAIVKTNDKTLLRDDPTLTATIQCAAQGTPTLVPGDCFEAAIGYTSASTGSVPVSIALSRWFINNDGINFDQADPTKFTATFELDRQNSGSGLIEF